MIYPLDERIQQALDSAYDPETGELLLEEDELFQQIEDIKADFETLVDSIASQCKNLKAEAADVRDEKQRLAKRQSQLEARAERAKRFLAYLLQGEKFKNGRHYVSYRKSEELVVDDEFIEWAKVNDPSLLKIEPEVRKIDVKNAIKSGTVFEFAHIEQKNNIQIR